jgi:hypothetical protein
MANSITFEQFRQGLADPNYAVGVMIANNPEDIADNLNNMGFNVSNFQDISNALNELLQKGQGNRFVEALSVKVRQDRMSPQEVAIVTQMGAAQMQVNGGTAKSFDLNAAFAGLATGALAYLAATGTNTVAPGAAAGNQPPRPPAPPDNTGMWIGIGIGALVLVVVLILVMKKKA